MTLARGLFLKPIHHLDSSISFLLQESLYKLRHSSEKEVMDSAFLDYFKLSEEDVLSALAEFTPAVPALEALFEKNKLEEGSYLTWAKNHYGLPVLKESFLEHTQQIETLQARYRNVFPKNVIPFLEWDGVLYLMCLEPVVFEAPQKVQFILAPYHLIKKWNSAVSTSATLTQVTEVLNLTPSGTDILNFDSHPESESPSESETEIISKDAPLGLNFPASPQELQQEYVVESPVTAADLTHSGLTVHLAHPEMENRPVELTQTKVLGAPELDENVSEMTHTGIIIQSDGATGVINSLKKYFDQAMILIFEKGILKPLKWDSTWHKASHAQSEIDLKSASIFRIVHDTKFSYHGHVIANPVNDAFFHGWNKGQYPEHVTLCPVIENKKVVGMILGLTSKHAAQKLQLRHIETIAQECLEKVLKPQTTAAA